jgi:hypothetical protein
VLKLNISSFKWLTLTLWWCTLLGLILPKTPSWGQPVAIALALLTISLLVLLLTERSRQGISTILGKTPNIDALLIGVPILSATIVFIGIVRFFSRKLPSNVLQFSLLAIIFTWVWLEIAVRTGKKLQLRSISELKSIIIVLLVSVTGILSGWSIYSSLDGQIFEWFISVLIGGLIVACIPDL